MATNVPRMIFLGFGKWARADRIYALEPLEGADRGHGRRTRVWVEGLAEPIVASRTERTILAEMGQDASATRSCASRSSAVKNGSARLRELTSSETGHSPSAKP